MFIVAMPSDVYAELDVARESQRALNGERQNLEAKLQQQGDFTVYTVHMFMVMYMYSVHAQYNVHMYS